MKQHLLAKLSLEGMVILKGSKFGPSSGIYSAKSSSNRFQYLSIPHDERKQRAGGELSFPRKLTLHSDSNCCLKKQTVYYWPA